MAARRDLSSRCRDQEPQAQFTCERRTGSVHGRERRRDFPVREGAQVRFQSRHRRKSAVYGLTGDVVFDIAVRHRPSQDGADALAQPTRGFHTNVPYRGQHLQHVFAPNLLNRHVAQDREGVTLKRVPPRHGVLTVPTTMPIHFERLLSCLAECGGAAWRFASRFSVSGSHPSATAPGWQRQRSALGRARWRERPPGRSRDGTRGSTFFGPRITGPWE